MVYQSVHDWDSAYANGDNIAGSHRWPEAWVEPAARFRAELTAAGRAQLDLPYGSLPRNRFDLFHPDGTAMGLLVFVHGGYWLAFDKSYWSHYARGALAHGYAVAMPSYSLCPDIRIAGIGAEIGAAIAAAATGVDGPIVLAGHSAGGQLAARMATQIAPIPEAIGQRICRVVSISGLHDLRPLMGTEMNQTLHIDEAEAMAESPALLRPRPQVELTCWVGGAERQEFRRQSALLANVWIGLGGRTEVVEEPNRHHFDVLDGMVDPDHPLVRAIVG